eukprot:jgi/Picre1/29898/NNA_005279.t1
MLEHIFKGYYPVYVAVLNILVHVAIALSVLVSLDRLDSHEYPMVAIQLPMFNERAVCQAIIDCCCEMNWEQSKLHIQVLDDSTDSKTRELVDERVLTWKERGVSISCLRRTNRQGYKAGAMKEGMEILSRQGYRYVAVFDADFKPEPDFLMRTIPHLHANPNVGYVQTRWVFTNPDESYLTKAQELRIWRVHCIEDAGGWNSRTTVEDMDLSLRAYLKGWKAIFLDDVTCLNELPASFFAFRKQQHRWTCGPAQLWLKAHKDIWSSDLSIFRKLELTIMYFGARKCATHFVALGFFCTLVPLSILTPEVTIPTWVLVHLPILVTLTTAAFTPKGWAYSILYVLFENAMGMVKLWAVITALLDLKRAQEWVVTTKLGSSDKRPGTTMMIPSCRIYGGELLFGIMLMSVGTLGLMQMAHWGLSSYMVVQGFVFMAFGFNMVDVGGILGGRMDREVISFGQQKAVTYARAGEHGVMQRQTTVPVIRLNRRDTIEPVESCPPEFALLEQSRPSSPSHSSASSVETLPSTSSTVLSESMSVIQIDANSSPTSKLSSYLFKDQAQYHERIQKY